MTSVASNTDDLLLECVERQTGESPKCAVIWLHGLGAVSYTHLFRLPRWPAAGPRESTPESGRNCR